MQVEEALQSTLESYGNALVAMGRSGMLACPPAGEDLRESLLNLSRRLRTETSLSVIAETEQLLEKELKTWGERAAHFYRAKTAEVQEILTIVAKATGQLGERDQRYAKQFGDVAERLQATAKLNDPTMIRQSLVTNVRDLKTCVAKMAKDGLESVAELRARIGVYEARLEEVEHIASHDALTGVANRRMAERQLELRVNEGPPFCVIYIDLNGFKQINDTFGHYAGDDLLQQFASELRTVFRATDLIGRWGGDEFIVLVDGDVREGQNRIEQIARWIDGEYSVATEEGRRKVHVAAAVGYASWQLGDTATKIPQRADAAMYEHKSRMKCTQGL